MSFKYTLHKMESFKDEIDVLGKIVILQKNLKQKYINEKLGKNTFEESTTKLFEPITQSTKEANKRLIKSIDNLKTQSYILPPLPSGYESTDDSINFGNIARKYINAPTVVRDYIFGVRFNPKENLFYIGDSPIIDNNSIEILFTMGGRQKYRGTEGLWSLLTIKQPEGYTKQEKELYEDIVLRTNALFQNYDPTIMRANANRGWKWRNLISDIWEDNIKRQTENRSRSNTLPQTGKGCSSLSKNKTKIIHIPTDPNELVKKLHLLLSSKSAGNTGLYNEINAILDQLLKKNILIKNNIKKY